MFSGIRQTHFATFDWKAGHKAVLCRFAQTASTSAKHHHPKTTTKQQTVNLLGKNHPKAVWYLQRKGCAHSCQEEEAHASSQIKQKTQTHAPTNSPPTNPTPASLTVPGSLSWVFCASVSCRHVGFAQPASTNVHHHPNARTNKAHPVQILLLASLLSVLVFLRQCVMQTCSLLSPCLHHPSQHNHKATHKQNKTTQTHAPTNSPPTNPIPLSLLLCRGPCPGLLRQPQADPELRRAPGRAAACSPWLRSCLPGCPSRPPGPGAADEGSHGWLQRLCSGDTHAGRSVYRSTNTIIITDIPILVPLFQHIHHH